MRMWKGQDGDDQQKRKEDAYGGGYSIGNSMPQKQSQSI